MTTFFHRAARVISYLIALLLALVWSAAGTASLMRPLYDIGQPHVGDVIVMIGSALALSPESTVALAHMLAGLKVFIGVYLFVTVAVAVYERLFQGACDDAMLDVGLLMSALASLIAAVPVVGLTGEPLQGVVGELMLAVLASALAIYGRGFIVPDERPKPTRPEPVVVAA